MSDSTTGDALEVWRGDVRAGDCDGSGRLDPAVGVARAMEGLMTLSAALGMPRAFAAGAAATLLVREHQIRWLDRPRAATPLHMTAGVIEMDDAELTLLQTLTHGLTGETCARIVSRVVHADAREGRPFAWPQRARTKAETIGVVLPEGAPTTGQTPPTLLTDPSDLVCLARGGVLAADCDAFGRLRTELVLARVSGGLARLIEPVIKAASVSGRRPSLTAHQHRLDYLRAPRAGDLLEVRARLSDLGGDRVGLEGWLMDPLAGTVWSTVRGTAALIDLDTGAPMQLPPHAVAA